MKVISKIFTSILLVGLMVILQACPKDPKLVRDDEAINFKVVNLTFDNGKLTAYCSNQTVTENYTFSVTINGQTTIVTRTKKSNELPVMAGNEIEVTFKPSYAEETEAYFTMPDGASYKATAANPTFKWTVPSNFTSGMQIKGESRFETDDFIFHHTGIVTLIAIE